jgi:3-dehydroquinate synthase
MTRLDDLPYPILVTPEVPTEAANFVRESGYARSIVLCDAKVAPRARAIARAIGKQTSVLSFSLGERRKTLRTVERVLEALAEQKVERTTLLVGVGGGVATDLFGFAGATYMRGVPFVAIATSLVAMVDAAIGGKTGVDLRAGKNLAGAFKDPVAVFCDVAALATLPPRAMREGLAEVVKHGIIEGDETFAELEELAAQPLQKWPWEKVIADSLRVKAMVVADDRLERGAREVLNLGHTFGHAIERASGYRVSHGSAVAIGLRAAGLLALRTGRFSESEHLRVLSLLALLRLPLIVPFDRVDAVLRAMSVDKKARDGKLRFVMPRKIGDVEYGVTAPLPSVRAVLKRIRETPGAAEFRR